MGLNNGINGWLTGEYYYYGVPDYLKSVKVIPNGADITIEYEPKEAVGSIYFVTPGAFSGTGGRVNESLNLGWKTDADADEGWHMQEKYGVENLGKEQIYYVDKKPGRTPTENYRRIWKKDFDGSGTVAFEPLTDDGYSVTILFEIRK